MQSRGEKSSEETQHLAISDILSFQGLFQGLVNITIYCTLFKRNVWHLIEALPFILQCCKTCFTAVFYITKGLHGQNTAKTNNYRAVLLTWWIFSRNLTTFQLPVETSICQMRIVLLETFQNFGDWHESTVDSKPWCQWTTGAAVSSTQSSKSVSASRVEPRVSWQSWQLRPGVEQHNRNLTTLH